jgi:membrane-associated phospholipid phosphatase
VPSSGTRPGPLLACAALTGLAVPLLYWLAVRTTDGQRIDDRSLEALSPERNPVAYGAAEDLLDTISVTSLGLLGLVMMALALLRGRLAVAVAAAVAIAGANVTTQMLKHGLDRPELVPTEIGVNSFPSGHATVAMSLALGLVLVAPSTLRPLAATLGGVYAAAIGAAVLLLAWHRPSDVLGAYLVAACWCALAGAAAAAAERGPRRTISARAERIAVGSSLVLLAAFLAVGAIALARRLDVLEFAEDRTGLVGAVVVAGIGAAACTALMALLLERSRVGDPPSAA